MAKNKNTNKPSETVTDHEADTTPEAPLDLPADEAAAAAAAATPPETATPAASAAAAVDVPTIVGPGTVLTAPVKEETEAEAGMRLLRARAAEIRVLIGTYALAGKKGAESQAKVNGLKERRRAVIRDMDAQVQAAERDHDKLWNGPAPDGLAWQVVELEKLERELAELERAIG